MISLGAINKLTREYVYPKIANKKDEYVCSDCNKDLILCQGDIRVHHFRHKVDTIKPCTNYSKPTETQLHKDAKNLMKKLLEDKTPIQIKRDCVSCKKEIDIILPEITEGSNVSLEYRFNYNNSLKIADVAHTNNNEIVGIYEIFNTHKTRCEDRPDPWVEINANELITLANTPNVEQLILKCTRCEKCKECQDKDKQQNLKQNLKQYEDCVVCGGSGRTYWSDDCYGACFECSCINCAKFRKDCKCIHCDKCDTVYNTCENDKEHTCKIKRAYIF